MGRIGNLMRERLGLPEQKIEKSLEGIDSEKKVRDYFDNVFKTKEINPMTNKQAYDLFQEKYFEINKRMYDLDFNANALRDIIYYFTKDNKFLSSKTRSFDKGLMLFGAYGLGKTSIMKSIRLIKHPNFNFGMKSTMDIVKSYDSLGSDGISFWTKENNFLFDDLGTEIAGKHYGKETEVMREILEKRHYEKLKTHVSTNLDNEQIRIKYGERVYSRMFEMFNVIIFDGNDYRQKL